MALTIQIPTIFVPTIAPLGTETEAFIDVLAHDSNDLECESIQEKVFWVFATEAFAAVAPGNLGCSVWISPDGTNYAQLGVTTNIVAAGVTGTAHAIALPFTAHSPWCMIRLQAVAPCNAVSAWAAVAIFSGKY